VGLLCVLATSPSVAVGQDGVSVEISKHARLTTDGGIVYLVRVSCGPLPGTLDFTEGLAGASQAKTGAEGEGGLSPDVVCDGVERTYTAALSSFTEATFRRGPAFANAGVNACSTVGDGQVCVSGSDAGRIVITGPLLGP
jgi:hypothetical protein